MKSLLTLLTFTALSFQAAFADWVLVQKASQDGQNMEVTIKIKGDKTRVDVGDQMTMVADAVKGDMVMFVHAQKMMMKMSPEMIKQATAQAMAMAGQAAGGTPPAKPVATGQMEKVGTYDTEVFTWTGTAGTGKFWVAKDFQGYKELNELQDKLGKAMGNPMSAVTPQNSDFPGMVVKSEMKVMEKTITSELVSAKQEPVADSAFEAPAGYNEMKIPGQ